MRQRVFLLAVLLAVLLAGACGDDAVVSSAGTMCVLDSECNSSLSCTFGRCHQECEESSDCGEDQMCVLDENRLNVCQLPEDVACVLNSDCPIPLVCAQDLKCRNECVTVRDCATRSQLCVPPGKVCAEPEDVVNGLLRLASGAADGGVSGEGGTKDGSVGVGTGGTGGGAGGTGGDAGISGAAGIGGGMDAGPTGMDASTQPQNDGAIDAAPDDASSTPDAPPQVPPGEEMEPNETRDQPNLIAGDIPLTATIGHADDIDYFEIRVPSSDQAGGFFAGVLRDVGPGSLWIRIFDADTNLSVVDSTHITVGTSVFFHWAGAAGKRYHLAVARQPTGAESFGYTLFVDYTAIDDPFEPNDTRETPAPLALGTTVTAYAYAGFAGDAPVTADYQDWYALQAPLAAGTVTIRIENVALNQTLRVGLYDVNHARLDSKSGTIGASFDAVLDVATPGMYRIMIDPTVPPDYAGNSQNLLDHFTRAYRLTVTQ